MTTPRNEPRMRRITIPNPAAGAEWAITPNDGGTWLVMAVRAILVTSVAVATRVVTVRVGDGTDTYLQTVASASQAASLTRAYCAYPGSTGGVAQGATVPVGWPGDGLILAQGHTARSVVENIDAGDQWSEITAIIASYPDRPPILLVPTSGIQPHRGMM